MNILCLFHEDFDGLVSAIVLKTVYPEAKLIPAQFYTIDEKIKKINFNLYDIVYILDISPKDSTLLDLSDKIVLIDHHSEELHNPAKNRFQREHPTKSAGELTLSYFKRKGYELNHLNRLCMLCSDYDLWVKRYALSSFINDLFKNFYTVEQFIERFLTGDCNLRKDEIEFIRKRKGIFKEKYESLEGYLIEEDVCVVYTDCFINEIADNLLKKENFKLVFVLNQDTGRCSIRTNTEVDLGKLVNKLGYGGGHPKSAGIFEKNKIEMKNKVLNVVDEFKKG